MSTQSFCKNPFDIKSLNASSSSIKFLNATPQKWAAVPVWHSLENNYFPLNWRGGMCIKPPLLPGTTASPRPCWVPKKQLDAIHSRGLLANSVSSIHQEWQRELPKGSPWPTAAPAGGILLQPPGFSGRKLKHIYIDTTTSLPFFDPEI